MIGEQVLDVVEFHYDEQKQQIVSSQNVTLEIFQIFSEKIGLQESHPKECYRFSWPPSTAASK